MSNIFYPRTVEVSGNLSGNGVAPERLILNDNITINSITASGGNISSITSSDGNITSVSGTTARYTFLTASIGSISQLTSSNASITNLSGTNVQYTSITSSRGNINELTSSNASIVILSGTTAQYNTITGTIANISTLTSSNASITTLSGTTARYSVLTSSNASINTISSSVGISASFLYGDGANIKNIGALGANNTWTGINTFNSPLTASSNLAVTNRIALGNTNPLTSLHIGSSPPGLQLINNTQKAIMLDTVQGEMLVGLSTLGSSPLTTMIGASLNSSDGGPAGSSFGTQGFIGTHTNHPFVIRTANTERMKFANDGKVGIKTSSPSNLLTVGANPRSANDSKELFHIGEDNGAFMSIGSSGSVQGIQRVIFGVAPQYVAAGNLPFIGTTTNHSFVIRTNGTERVHVDTGGKVGINTTPNYNLDVNGTAWFNQATTANSTLTVNGLITANAGITIPNNQGITFSEGVSATGKTLSSSKLEEYEYGTYTCARAGGLTGNAGSARYLRIGQVIHVWISDGFLGVDFNQGNTWSLPTTPSPVTGLTVGIFCIGGDGDRLGGVLVNGTNLVLQNGYAAGAATIARIYVCYLTS